MYLGIMCCVKYKGIRKYCISDIFDTYVYEWFYDLTFLILTSFHLATTIRHFITFVKIYISEDMTSNDIDTTIEYTVSKFNFHNFKDQILEKKLIFQIIKMQDSLIVYVNDKDDNNFSDLSLAMNNRHDNTPIATKLIGNPPEDFSEAVACRFSKRTGKVVYFSCNVTQDRILVPLIEKRIIEEMKAHPDKF